ncbi:MAG: CHAD domain-containing protein [Actinobacteria bacterium]|nr:CHAD domain-containing protein [Actinomycetota bacterium]
MKQLCFRTDEDRSRGFTLLVEERFEVEREPLSELPITPYDTFDWRLYGKGYFAYAAPGSFSIQGLRDHSPFIACALESVPGFWWEFHDENLRGFLKDIAGIRALLPLATFNLREQQYLARNEDQKIVGRFSLLTHDAHGNGSHSYLLVKALRGYPEERDLLLAMARESAMGELPHPFMEELLLTAGIHPGDYSSKLDLRLNRKQNVTEAALVIHRNLLSTIKSNIPGIIEDYDTEFLHDFRVATRRTRACLSQIKEAFPPEVRKKYSADFKSIAKECNLLRDLDVYLLEKQGYYDMLPQRLHAGLDRYFARITRKRNSQQKRFADYLRTEAFGSALDSWEAFLANPQAPAASPPALEVARSRIRGSFAKIIKRGRSITDASPDEDLHRLRIECKRLRYLLEFFASLFPRKKTESLIGHLKGLQDDLGEFNDLTMQQINLNEYLKRVQDDARKNRLEAAAIGGLLAMLHERQGEVRRGFYGSFSDFDSRQVHAICEELFGRG